jgi:hypothetical protein
MRERRRGGREGPEGKALDLVRRLEIGNRFEIVF